MGRVKPTKSMDIFTFGSLVYYLENWVPPMRGVTPDSELLDDPTGRFKWPVPRRTFLPDEARAIACSCLTVSADTRLGSMEMVTPVFEHAVCSGRRTTTNSPTV